MNFGTIQDIYDALNAAENQLNISGLHSDSLFETLKDPYPTILKSIPGLVVRSGTINNRPFCGASVQSFLESWAQETPIDPKTAVTFIGDECEFVDVYTLGFAPNTPTFLLTKEGLTKQFVKTLDKVYKDAGIELGIARNFGKSTEANRKEASDALATRLHPEL